MGLGTLCAAASKAGMACIDEARACIDASLQDGVTKALLTEASAAASVCTNDMRAVVDGLNEVAGGTMGPDDSAACQKLGRIADSCGDTLSKARDACRIATNNGDTAIVGAARQCLAYLSTCADACYQAYRCCDPCRGMMMSKADDGKVIFCDGAKAERLLFLEATPAEFKKLSASDRPERLNDLPCFYYWRESIDADTYTHPIEKWDLDMKGGRVAEMDANIHKMLGNGVPIPIVKDHKRTADNTLGYIVDSRVSEGGRLDLLYQFLGQTACETGLKNHVSIGAAEQFVDGKGREYGLTIEHVGATPLPVVPDQGQFLKAASRDPQAQGGQTKPAESSGGNPMEVTLKFSADDFRALGTLVPGLAEAPDAERNGKLLSFLRTQAAEDELDAGGPEAVKNLSRGDIVKNASTNRKQVRDGHNKMVADLATASSRITELSKQVPKPLDADSEQAMVTAIATTRDLCIAGSTGITKPTADALYNLLVEDAKGKRNVLGLSRAANPNGDSPIALAVFRTLQSNKPTGLGELTGDQVRPLSRTSPDGEDDDAAAKEAKKAKKMLGKYLHGGEKEREEEDATA